MVNIFIKGRLLFFLMLVALLSSCGGQFTTKTGTTSTSHTNMTLPGNSGTPGAQLIIPVQRAIAPNPTSVPNSANMPTSTSVPSSSPILPGSSQRFTTLPPGSPLPSDAQCAASVRRSSWEPRPGNATANNTNIYAEGYRLTGSYLAQYGYEQRVTGNFTGTTDEILQWGACKWGIDEDIVRAQAEMESSWFQSKLGDCNGGTVPETHGCQSVGILQIKGADLPPTHPGTWPYAYESTAFNVDYMEAILRTCFEGKETWMGNGYHAGDIWGCVGRWFSGDWYGTSMTYIGFIQGKVTNKNWLKSGF